MLCKRMVCIGPDVSTRQPRRPFRSIDEEVVQLGLDDKHRAEERIRPLTDQQRSAQLEEKLTREASHAAKEQMLKTQKLIDDKDRAQREALEALEAKADAQKQEFEAKADAQKQEFEANADAQKQEFEATLAEKDNELAVRHFF